MRDTSLLLRKSDLIYLAFLYCYYMLICLKIEFQGGTKIVACSKILSYSRFRSVRCYDDRSLYEVYRSLYRIEGKRKDKGKLLIRKESPFEYLKFICECEWTRIRNRHGKFNRNHVYECEKMRIEKSRNSFPHLLFPARLIIFNGSLYLSLNSHLICIYI